MAMARLKLMTSKDAQSAPYKVVKDWAEHTMRIIGVDVQTKGLENIPESNCLFVANHQSYVDIPLILSQIDRPIGFIAKKQLKKVPLMSFWMKKINCIFLNRESAREAVESINEGANLIRNHCSMMIFPEGTRSKSDRIGEFKKGSMKLALKSSAPIVPITICGSYRAYEQHNSFSEAKVKLIIGKPIFIDELEKEEKKNLADYIKSIIEENMNESI